MWTKEPVGPYLAKAIRDYLGSEIDLSGTYVAGGFIRAFMSSEKPIDMDLFFLNKGEFGRTRSLLLSRGFATVADTDNAVTMTHGDKVVQLCKHPYGTVQEILKSFDFTVTQAAVDGEKLYTHRDFYKDLAARRLVFNVEAETPALNRLAKYVAKGFTISNSECLAMALAVKKYEARTGGSD
jgi:hypothetical protein